MDQKKLDGTKPARPWFGRAWGRIWPWGLMGWLWTGLFFSLMIGLIIHVKALDRAGDTSADQWFMALPILVIVYLIVAYAKSRKP